MLKKSWQIAVFAAVCILLNYGLKYWTALVSIPLWLDSVGTALAAYVLGPVSGAIVGASVNVIYGFSDPVSLLYAITNIAVGLIIGICARHKMMDNIFRMLTACTLVTFAAACISTLINGILYSGATGNEWGDGILAMLQEWGIPWVLAAFIAEFFLDFFDKFITILFLYAVILLYRYTFGTVPDSNETAPVSDGKSASDENGSVTATVVRTLLAVALTMGLAAGLAVVSAKADDSDYSEYIQTVYSNDNGLLSGEANDIASADNGILWIGTYAGLYRYSGNTFEYMNSFDSVKNVNCLYVDMEGRLWIGTNDDGLSICIDEQITQTFNEENGFPSNSVRSITQCSDGSYYIGTSGSLVVVSLVGGSKVEKIYSEITYASNVTADDNGHIAAVTSSGELFLLNPDGILQELTDSDEENFSSCEFLDDGTLLVGDSYGRVHTFTVTNDKLVAGDVLDTLYCDWINKVYELDTGAVFICADNGIGWFDENREFHSINSGSFNSSIDSMTVDYQGNLWFCSSRLGIMKMCSSAFKELYPEAGLESKVVNTITEWNGCLYFGTDSGLDIVEKETLESVQNELTELCDGNRIRCLLVDSKGLLWICDYVNGIICVNANGSKKIYTADQGALGVKFRSVAELSDGTVAATSELGVTYIKNGKVIATFGQEDGLETSLALCLLETNDGKVLVGTDGGGIAVIENGTITKTLTREDGLGSGVILRMVKETGTDNIFIVTSNGICYMNASGNIRELSKFPYSNNYDIYDPGTGSLYVTGSAGIYIVNKAELLANSDSLDYENLNYLNGLRGTFTANAWNYVDSENKWYIGGGSGVTVYDLESRNSRSTASYRMLMNSITADDTVYHLNGEKSISLSRSVSSIQLQPEIINYSANEPYVSYYLEGKDTEKTVVLQSELGTILYTDLPSGTYRFHLGIQDSVNGKITEEQIFTIVKEADIYDHVWFKFYFFLELIFIVAWFTWFITKKTALRTMEFQRKEIAFAKEQIRMGNETILAIARTVDAKDSTTSDHSTRVAEYSVLLAERMGYSPERLENLRKIALLHDIGKIGVPDAVLKKPGKLTDEEYEIMKSHVTRGAEILKDFTLIENVQEGALYHHERYDGKGYAMGLKGEEIPEKARIIGVADAFDAMTANRVYRNHLPFEKVLEEIRNGRGKQFDPHIADILLDLVEEGKINPAIYAKDKEAET